MFEVAFRHMLASQAANKNTPTGKKASFVTITSTSHPYDNAILSPLDAQDLFRQGLTTNPSRGTRKLRKRRLNRSSDEEYQNLPLPSSPSGSNSTSASRGFSPDAYAVIPSLLVSHATIVYLGFTESAAEEILALWTGWPEGDDGREIDNGPVTFLSMATARIRARGTDTASEDDEEWIATMDVCGINTELQDAILDPHYKSIRLSESCKFWLDDTIRMRYRGLLEIQKASRERHIALQHEVAKPGQQEATKHSKQEAAKPGQQEATKHSKQEAMKHSQQEATKHSQLSTLTTSRSISTLRTAADISPETGISTIKQSAPGYTVLYKGCDQARIMGMFNDNGQIASLSPLDSSLRGDFNSRNAALNWAVDYEIAMRYAC
jgi:hypothetical protein